MTIQERIRSLRKRLGLTQEEFAAKIRVNRSVVANMELGRSTIADSMIALISKTFSVSEQWLRDGTGDMEAPTDDLQAFIDQYHPDDVELRLFQTFAAMPDNAKAAVLDVLRQLGKALELDSDEPAEPAPVVPLERDRPRPIMDEYTAEELEQLGSAAAHDTDGVSPYVPLSEQEGYYDDTP